MSLSKEQKRNAFNYLAHEGHISIKTLCKKAGLSYKAEMKQKIKEIKILKEMTALLQAPIKEKTKS